MASAFSNPIRGRGFTLIELVVVIGIVMILMGLALPALSGGHGQAKLTRALAIVLGAVFMTFAGYCLWLSIHPPAAPAACGCMGSRTLVDPGEWWWLALRNAVLTPAALCCSWAACRRAIPGPGDGAQPVV